MGGRGERAKVGQGKRRQYGGAENHSANISLELPGWDFIQLQDAAFSAVHACAA